MKPWTSCLASIGLAGSCLLWAGCGGGDVPDASTASDSSGGGATPSAIPVPEGPAPVAATPSMPGQGTPPAGMPGQGAPPAAAVAAKVEEAPAAGAASAEGKSDVAPSATTEMLALANAPGGGGEKTEGADAAKGPQGQGLPGQGAPPGQGMMPGPGGPIAANYPGVTPGQAGDQQGYPGGPGARQGYPGAPGAAGGNIPGAYPGMVPGGPGAMPGAAGIGGPGGANTPADYSTPQAAVQTFLAAIASKNPERITEAIALRAGTPQPGQPAETSVQYQKFFDMAHEGSLDASDLETIAKKFEGMNIQGQNTAKSSGRLGIIVGKSDKGDMLTRTITVRKEKSGWKVCDVSGQHETPMMLRGTPGRTGRRR